MNTKPKALIAMSGGVDSSVTAALMMERGYDCTGVHMRLSGENIPAPDADAVTQAGRDSTPDADALEQAVKDDTPDADAAAAVAARMGMPFFTLDERAAFARCVIGPFAEAYRNGITPNPCISCNRNLKFGRLLACARERGCDTLATGHYARVSFSAERGRFVLKKACDPARDQSYVLYMLTQEQLAHIAFPLGDYTKQSVRARAASYGFANAGKKDSQDICFIPDGDHARFIEAWMKTASPEGNFVDETGRVLGRHKGIIRYTIGQRRGLGISSDRPFYVREIRAAENEIVLGRREDIAGTSLIASGFIWLSVPEPDAPLRALAKIRYRYREAPCTAEVLDRDRVRVTFDTPQPAITPGQAVVLYDGDMVLGGGTICA